MSSFALPLIASREDAAAGVRSVVNELGIESRPVVAGNLIRQPFLRDKDVTVMGRGTPEADWVHSMGLYVGNGHHVTEKMVITLTDAMAAAATGS